MYLLQVNLDYNHGRGHFIVYKSPIENGFTIGKNTWKSYNDVAVPRHMGPKNAVRQFKLELIK